MFSYSHTNLDLCVLFMWRPVAKLMTRALLVS
jgi:hypothetical protein